MIASARRRTTSRRDLERNPHFLRLSPAPGELDTAALDSMVDEDPGTALTVLTEATGAVDPRLRELARRLAGRVIVRLTENRLRSSGERGTGKIVLGRAGTEGDVDLDASLDAIADAKAAGRPVSLEDLAVRRWARPRSAIAVVVDRSGSMGGDRLANAALAASVVAMRAPGDHAVLAFAGDVTVVKGIDEDATIERVVDDLLSLRGHGSTDLALALYAARAQLARSSASRRIAVVLSDCRHNCGGEPLTEARWFDQMLVVAPAGDSEEARAFAASCGAKVAEVAGPTAIPETLVQLLA
ncbi:MAG TPA: vWA domain-containing protein [Acidimicrobiales bacterium]|nr:vWA domain-containing protein [Acidimicrobiales bacterium]